MRYVDVCLRKAIMSNKTIKKAALILGLAISMSVTAAPIIKKSSPAKAENKESELCLKLQKDIIGGLKEIAHFTALNTVTPVSQRSGKIIFDLDLRNNWNLINLTYSLYSSNSCKSMESTPTELFKRYTAKAQECAVAINDLAVFSKTQPNNVCQKETW